MCDNARHHPRAITRDVTTCDNASQRPREIAKIDAR
jgi:hypothetical protein